MKKRRKQNQQSLDYWIKKYEGSGVCVYIDIYVYVYILYLI